MIAVKVDLVGLLVSICLLGIRYPHYVILAALINFFGFCLGAFLLPDGLETIIVSGIFSTAEKETAFTTKTVLFAVALFANYAAARLSGLPALKNAASFCSPFAVLDNPFSVINLRFAAAFLLYNLILLFF